MTSHTLRAFIIAGLLSSTTLAGVAIGKFLYGPDVVLAPLTSFETVTSAGAPSAPMMNMSIVFQDSHFFADKVSQNGSVLKFDNSVVVIISKDDELADYVEKLGQIIVERGAASSDLPKKPGARKAYAQTGAEVQ